MISYPQILPYFLKVGPIELRWYGLAYIVGIFAGTASITSTLKRRFSMTLDDITSMMVYLMGGILLGGRLGYILFYDLSYYLEHPGESIALWHGGMSFHGGCLGCLLAIWLFSRPYRVRFWGILDGISAAAPLGILLGRLANFINGELFGRVTTVPWAMVFPNGGPLPRHPSQLYEAFFEGVVLWMILYPLYRRGKLPEGCITALFLVGYGGFRFGIEFFREPDVQVGFLWLGFSLGQWLCLGMIGIGILILGLKRPMKLGFFGGKDD